MSVAEAELASGHRFERVRGELVCTLCQCRGREADVLEMFREAGLAVCRKSPLAAAPTPKQGDDR